MCERLPVGLSALTFCSIGTGLLNISGAVYISTTYGVSVK